MSFAGRINIPFSIEEAQAKGNSTEWIGVGRLWGKIQAYGKSEAVSHIISARYRPDDSVKIGQRLSYMNERYLIIDMTEKIESKHSIQIFVKQQDYLNE